MQFHIDIDAGNAIHGWFVPDNPSYSGRLLVKIDDEHEYEVEASYLRPDIKDGGIHPTGHVGFAVDENIAPGLKEAKTVSLVDAESRVLIYRRFSEEDHLKKKVAFFNHSIFPSAEMLNRLNAKFAMSYTFVERYPLETMAYVVRTPFSNSVLVAGRPCFNRYSTWMRESGFSIVALLKDPFEDLAERLLLLTHLTRSENSTLLATFGTGLLPLISFVKRLDFENEKQMLSIFRGASPAEKQALRNPLTRMLGCDPDEEAERRHVSVALDNLASMDVVGTRKHYQEFRAGLAALLEADVLGEVPAPTFSAIEALSRRLSQMSIVTDFLEHDLALYSFAEEAIDLGLQKDLNESS